MDAVPKSWNPCIGVKALIARRINDADFELNRGGKDVERFLFKAKCIFCSFMKIINKQHWRNQTRQLWISRPFKCSLVNKKWVWQVLKHAESRAKHQDSKIMHQTRSCWSNWHVHSNFRSKNSIDVSVAFLANEWPLPLPWRAMGCVAPIPTRPPTT